MEKKIKFSSVASLSASTDGTVSVSGNDQLIAIRNSLFDSVKNRRNIIGARRQSLTASFGMGSLGQHPFSGGVQFQGN